MNAKLTPFLLLFLVLGQLKAQTASALKDQAQMRIVAVRNAEDKLITSISNVIDLHQEARLFVPTAFSPNGDGINDSFLMKGMAFEDFFIRVFNRWGEELFQSNDSRVSWDGTFQGKPVPEGVYVYEVSYAAKTGHKHTTQKGTMTLLR